VLRTCAATLEAHGEPEHLEGLALRVVEDLEGVESGEQREIVLAAAVAYVRSVIGSKFRAASVELSTRIGLPAASLRTRAGWVAALGADGHGVRALDRLQDLPGTATVLGVAELQALAATLDHIDNGSLYLALDGLWRELGSDSGTFDAAVDELERELPGASRIGWALIKVETLKHVNLIWHQANKLERSFPDRSASDLLGWGWVGLRTALRYYNPRLGFTFSTYACTRIIGSIRDGVRMESPIPKRLGTFQRKVAAVEAELAQALGRAPTLEEVSQRVGAEISQLGVLRRTSTPAHLDEPAGSEGDTLGSRLLVDTIDVEETAWLAVCRSDIEAALEAIEPDEAEAVRLLILEGMSAADARVVTGATARQMRQRKERGLAALRTHLDHWNPAL
jgi:RNA polymerase sigma factor (sigma-70 family)